MMAELELEQHHQHRLEDEDATEEATSRVCALSEMWLLFAKLGGDFVEAWRWRSVCRASNDGVRQWLRTLPGVVVCGGVTTSGAAVGSDRELCDVWRLDMATLRWDALPHLRSPRYSHACCVVNTRNLVVLGGRSDAGYCDTVEILRHGRGATAAVGTEAAAAADDDDAPHASFENLPSLSCGALRGGCSALPLAADQLVEEEEEEGVEKNLDDVDTHLGRVMLIGQLQEHREHADVVTVHRVDLVTGVCLRQPPLLRPRTCFSATRLPDGRVICVGQLQPGATAAGGGAGAPAAGGGAAGAAAGATAGGNHHVHSSVYSMCK